MTVMCCVLTLNGFIAKKAAGLDFIGEQLYSREQIERAITLGASVTFYAVPPSAKVDGLTPGQALLAAGGFIGLVVLTRLLRR